MPFTPIENQQGKSSPSQHQHQQQQQSQERSHQSQQLHQYQINNFPQQMGREIPPSSLPQPTLFSNIPLRYRHDNGSGFMSFNTETSTISVNDEDSVQISSDGDNSGSQRQESDDGDYPDIDTLPPMTVNSGWIEEQDSDFPDIDTLPPLRPPALPSRVQLLSQNDREEMRVRSKQNAIDDISRNFRCHRPGCEIDENSISNPRLRRQQVGPILFVLPLVGIFWI